ncbi:MAG: acetate--CoA ligase [Anaerolineae bacterium]|nr:acetate--CoA ligase [Anaerolineae bacterium]MCO5194686.1 acetate--CoA ligase [Anaerolineae bacterium]MCO5199402.1 acetate--CoA ligase [Anaerolineae bacterium]
MSATNEMSGEVYYPSAEIIANAHIPDYDAVHQAATDDLAGFWDKIAHENFEWAEPWHTTLDESDPPFYKWFVGAKTNIVHNALDRHVKTATRNKAALIFEGEPGDSKVYTYQQLNYEVCKFASVLRAQGVRKGDRVTIYMGRIPELMIAMLACAKVGAMHSVVYGGFSTEALLGRIEDSASKVLITCDGAWLRGKVIELKEIANAAVERSETIQSVICVKRIGHDVEMVPDRDYWYHDLMALPIADPNAPTEVMDAEDPLFILYTSGTTGRPKAILHTHGGYMVGTATTLKWVFDIKPEDIWWCAADPGWITGHSYIVYSPLVLGATSFMYEGAPTHPYPDRWWSLIAKYGITILYTAPTAIRGLMRFGETWPQRHDLSSLRLLGSVGEPINPEAWKWYHRVIGNESCPIMDTWWQTETGNFMITPLPSVPLKPGSATRGFPGVQVDVVDEEGNPVGVNEEGFLVIKRPWPAMLRTLFGDPERYVAQYWSRYAEQGWYLPGDSAKKDEDGYIWVIGRIDDVIKVSGYRLGTAEIESALVSHPAVAEAAVIGVPDELRGNVIKAYCILRDGFEPSEQLERELRDHVGVEMGPIAKPSAVAIVDSLPKTRSGKIMRRVLRAQTLGQDVGDLSTLAD